MADNCTIPRAALLPCVTSFASAPDVPAVGSTS